MIPLNNQLNRLFFLFAAILIFHTVPAFAQPIREPVYAGSFYPRNPDDLTGLLDKYTGMAAKTPLSLPKDAALKALILPHAGYVYSGFTAAHASRVLNDTDFEKIIIMGPDHRAGFSNCAVSNVAAYQTPLGNVPVHPDAGALKNQYREFFKHFPQANDREHAIEVQIPFLQHYLNNFQIVPIVMGPGDPIKFTDAIESVLDSETLIVASSDLSHYLPYQQAVETDRTTIGRILDMDVEKLSDNSNRACGILPIVVLTHLATRHNWEPMLLHYSNSGDTAGPKDKVVGYAAIAYFQSSIANPQKGATYMDKKKGEVLLKVARKSIADSLSLPTPDADTLSKELSDDIFTTRRGTFVTLKINDQLRGCIGNLTADKSLLEGVRDNAINAAFHDPRFPPLSKNEFEKVDIEISLLTEPRKLEFKNSGDLLEKLRPDVDGVIIRKGPYSSTFLPQVWEQLPDKKSFLSHLCQKAGLSPDEWQRPGLEVMVYQVQYFEEGH